MPISMQLVKNVLFTAVLLQTFTVPGVCQKVVVEEFFSTGIDPSWGGIPSHFTTVTNIDSPLLQLSGDSENGGVSWLSIPVFAAYGSWEFHVMLDFATSNNNRSYVHLISDSENPEEGNGYAIRIGESGSAKHFRLVRFDEGREADVITHGDRLIEAGKGYNLKIERGNNGIWQISSSEGRDSSPQPDGLPGFDQTHQGTGWFIFNAIYTSTRAERFYWGDLRISKNPAFVIHTERSGPDRMRVHYSESNLSGTDDPASYRILPVMNTSATVYKGSAGTVFAPVDVETISPAAVELIFTEKLPGSPSDLELTGISDFYGQGLAQTGIRIILYDYPEYGGVVINEYLYDDTGGIPRYVELYNPGPGWYNLRNWELRDRGSVTRIISENNRTLEPGGYLVLTAHAQELQNRFGKGPWLRMDRFPSLNRASSDQVRLLAPGGVLIDSLEYQPSVFDAGGRSVERRSPLVGSDYPENWGVSLDVNGGTPGLINTVQPPDTPPRLLEHRTPDSRTIALQFSRSMDRQTIRPGHIILIPGITADSVQALSATEFLVHLSGTMANTTEYLLDLNPVTDVFGNPLHRTEYAFIYYHIEEADYRDVVVNEILYRPLEGVAPRFIEVVNRSDKNIDLSGWTIGRSSATVGIPDSPDLILLPGEFAVFSARPGLPDMPPSVKHVTLNLPGFSRFGDSVFLKDRNEFLIDTLSYQPSWGGDSDGRSLERADPDAASNDPVNWKTHPTGHSAGFENMSHEPDLTPPQVVKAVAQGPGTAEILFSEFLDTAFPPVISAAHRSVLIQDFDPFRSNRIIITLPEGIPDEETMIEINEAMDVAGNSAGLLQVPLAHTPRNGDLVINEIMYQPLQNRYGSYPDQSQYVEFLNRSERTVSLAGVHLHDETDKHGQVRSIEPQGGESAWLPPGGYGLIHADTAAVFEETSLARFFGLDFESAWLQARRSTLNLTSAGRAVYLSGQNGLVLDSLTYSPGWHNPNVHDPRGISLERIHPGGPSDDARNWSSNVMPEGGTPGAPNSILQLPEPDDSNRSLTITPNPFSPDGDGFNDHLFISYRLDSPDYLVTIQIFDRYGRPVRRLVDRERAGFEGHFTWDGQTDSGITGRIGIYIILFYARDARNGKSLQIKQTAVLARPL
ncbi:MAG: lamin tail domain-containing protein [Cyclonatronaceae bacterium]